ncbi:RNA methyltransferase [bacterium]|nr:RNA methyltransferase [bacterium]
MKVPSPVVVFVEPQSSGNVGAIARIMSNFGIKELRLVGHPASDNQAFKGYDNIDWILACGGKNVLEEVNVYSSLQDALFDVNLSIASTGRCRDSESGYARPHHDMQDALESVGKHFAKAPEEDNFKWALVIGRENDGLNEIEVSQCQSVVNIPTDEENPSMNAAMATGCLLYHWHIYNIENKKALEQNPEKLGNLPRNLPKRIRLEKEAQHTLKAEGPFPTDADFSEPGRKDWSTVRQLEKFTNYLMETIQLTEFVKYPDQEAVRARMRRWTQATPIPVGELLFAFELLYHVRAKITGKFSKRGFLDNTQPKSEKLQS